jgi:acetylornithine deacetylase/succinyl-diaminopimelate desuccinylase-like protein
LNISLDTIRTRNFVNRFWDDIVMPALTDYIRIPCKSPLFDADWEKNGHMEQAVALAVEWCRTNPVDGMDLEVVRLPGLTPLLWIEVRGTGSDTVLFYGHLDKQPEMTGWREDLGPWKPVVEGDLLYGRGSVDDGYALFSAMAALRALQEQGVPRARCVFLIECSEESGSPDLPAYLEALAARIGTPGLVIALDSGCGNYEQLWCTTSLRGLIGGTLTVEVLTEGVHSGDASGIVPSSFRIARQLLSRLEDEETGRIVDRAFHAEIPPDRIAQAAQAAEILGEQVYAKYPFSGGTQPLSRDPAELIVNRAWRPALSVTGAGGFQPLASAGNVLRPLTALKLSLRLPPTLDGEAATAHLKALLENDPPYGAVVRFDPKPAASGWCAPTLAPWYAASLEQASEAYFGKPAVFQAEGVTIPFMSTLGKKFPRAQFLITGVLGPRSNAHGPNEFLHLPAVKRLTCCVAQVVADHCRAT